jgi:hypothetical protein
MIAADDSLEVRERVPIRIVEYQLWHFAVKERLNLKYEGREEKNGVFLTGTSNMSHLS